MGKVRIILFLLVFSPAWLFAHDLVSQIIPANNIDHHYETMLINALENIKVNQLNLAIADLKHLVKVKPDFKLAQLIYADLLLARSRPIRDFGNYSELHHEYISALRDEARARWQHHLAPPDEDKIPEFLVQLSNGQEYVIAVDLHASRLYLFQNHKGTPRLISDFYVSIGKNGIGKYEEGDQKTPIGVYFVEGFIDPDKLPDFYGDGAFPIDYPNVWDKRQNRTGYGIWLHGTPADTYSRPPRDSDGCVILSNQDLNTLSPYLQAGKTPVLLAQDIKWISVEEWQASQRDYMQFIEQWRSDWESRDVELYLRHYAKDYSGLGKDYKSWVEYKRHVTPSKSFIRVNISDTSMFLYPGEPGVLVVTFDQDYQSDNVHRRFVKRQYWRRDRDGKWKIVYEGSVS